MRTRTAFLVLIVIAMMRVLPVVAQEQVTPVTAAAEPQVSVTDQNASTASVTFLVGIRRFFPKNFPQNQNNLLRQFLKFLEPQAIGPVF